LRPLDEAVELLRGHMAEALPLYLAGVAPMSVAIFILIDAVAARKYSAAPEGCLLLAAATVWKWAFTSAVQGRMRARLSGKPGAPLRGRLLAIICVKLAASMAMLWGSMVVIPPLYGFFLSGLAAPALLDRGGPALDEAEWISRWVSGSMGRAVKIVSAIGALFLTAYLGVTLLQLMVTGLVMPSLLGMDATGAELTLYGVEWQMAILYLLFLVFDLYWTVAAVTLYYDVQSRRAGVDLGSRLKAMGG
jgi:hypothetical protein